MATAKRPTPAPAGGQPVAAFVAGGSAAGTWTLDPAVSRVEFHSASMWGMAKIHGQFTAVSATGSVSPSGAVTGEITIQAASLDTKNKKRDIHLRSKDFFDVAQYSTITYSVDRISPLDGNRVEVLGVLTVRGQRHPLPFTATVTDATADAVTIETELEVDRSHFGMGWSPMKMASMSNRIVVNAHFRKADH